MEPTESFEKRFSQYSKGALPPDKEEPTVLVDTVSGKYLELDRQGKLAELVKLQSKRQHLRFALATIEAELSQFSNPLWLLNFFVKKKGEQFNRKLQNRDDILERQRKALQKTIAAVEEEIRKIEPLILEIPIPNIDTSFPSSPFLEIDENADAYIVVRDYVIKQCASKGYSDERICKTLDHKLMVRDGPPKGIPDNWIEKFGEEWVKKYHNYNFYLAAYTDRRTKNRMQKMISTAKKRIR
jgi:hypothetical protein